MPTTTPQRRIVCAAIRAADGEVLLGIRHYSADMHRQIAARGSAGMKFMHRHGPDQGFVDQYGEYLTREEAHVVASFAGQIIRPGACREGPHGNQLFSEGLY
jgi:hypothetical protein